MIDVAKWFRAAEQLSWSEAAIWAAHYADDPKAVQPYWDAIQRSDAPQVVRYELTSNVLQLTQKRLAKDHFGNLISAHQHLTNGLRAPQKDLPFWTVVLACDYLTKQRDAWELRATDGPIGQVRRNARAAKEMQRQLVNWVHLYDSEVAPRIFARSADLAQVYLIAGSGRAKETPGYGVPRLGLTSR